MDGKKLLMVAVLAGLVFGVGATVAAAPAGPVEADAGAGFETTSYKGGDLGVVPLCKPGSTSCGGG